MDVKKMLWLMKFLQAFGYQESVYKTELYK